MKYDRKITSLIKEINDSCNGYLGYVYSANTCAMTDRIVEKIIEKSKEIDKLHSSRFHIEKEPMDNIKNLLRLFDNKNVYEIETALLLYEFLDKDVNDISNKEIMEAYEIVRSQDEVFDEYIKDSIKLIVDQNKNLDVSIKDWYIKTYPKDSIGKKISSCTFLELNNFLESNPNNDTYNLLGCNDFVMRERCFQELSKLTHQSYSDIYQKWISKVNDRQEEYDEIEKE